MPRLNTPVREILDLGDETGDIVALCEVTGQRTLFVRGETNVAILVSFDEYAALRETLDLLDELQLIGERSSVSPHSLARVEVAGATSFAPAVEGDLESLPDRLRESALQIIGIIDADPLAGSPLFEPLRGFWSLRREGVRAVYRIAPDGKTVVVLRVGQAEVIV